MSSSALVPAAQAVLTPIAESLNLGRDADNRQYQHILNVAASQENRLARHAALRRCPGYNLDDPWLVVGDEDLPVGKKRKGNFPNLVLGVPCMVVGGKAVVAYLGPDSSDQSQCRVRELDGRMATHSRKNLLPMPTRSARQGDWALPVGLTGDQASLNGKRGLCGLVGQFSGPPPIKTGFWISFEPSDPTFPPENVLIAEENLVTLPTPPAGAPQTPWETKAISNSSSSSLLRLVDESIIDNQLAIRHCDENENGDDSSAELSDGSEDDDDALVMALGALVEIVGPKSKPRIGQDRYGRVETLQGESVVVRLLDGRRGEEVRCKTCDLTLVRERDLGVAATCQHCKTAEPDDDANLLMCEHFSTSCLGCAHLACLSPPLKKVPKGPWYCQACVPRKSISQAPALTNGETASKKPDTKVKEKAAPEAPTKGKASAKASSSSKESAKAKPAAKKKQKTK